MGTVLEFRVDKEQVDSVRKTETEDSEKSPNCQIIIFPGIRYERHDDDSDNDIADEDFLESTEEENYS